MTCICLLLINLFYCPCIINYIIYLIVDIAGNSRRQLISSNSMTDCLRGGVLYKNVGENNPRIVIEKNQIRQCGLKVN